MEVYAWGRGEDGQLGLGDTSDQYEPRLIKPLKEMGIVRSFARDARSHAARGVLRGLAAASLLLLGGVPAF